MHEILRKRILRRLEALPEGKLYQILDYIEFIESRYGEPSDAPSGLQGFAERLEDRMRARSVVPSVMSGTMKVFGAAGKVLDEVSSVGRGLVEGIGEGLNPPAGASQTAQRRPAGPRPVTEEAPATGRNDAGAVADESGAERPAARADAAPAGPVLADEDDDPRPA